MRHVFLVFVVCFVSFVCYAQAYDPGPTPIDLLTQADRFIVAASGTMIGKALLAGATIAAWEVALLSARRFQAYAKTTPSKLDDALADDAVRVLEMRVGRGGAPDETQANTPAPK